MYFNRSTSNSDFMMINLLSIYALFLCVWLSSAQPEEICIGKGKYCVYKEMCVNGKIEQSAILLRRSNLREKCSKYEVCCSVESQYARPRKPRALLQQYEVICNRPGDHCVPQEACIDGFIDKTAGVMVKPFMKQNRCGVNEVCCQNKQKNICAGTDKHCVPEKTCINGTIDTTAGGILNPLSNGPVECSENEVCCSYPVQPKPGVDCNGVGKVCVAENLCVNGIIDKGGRNVLIRRMSGPGKCTESQVCCSLPARKPKKKMCTGGKTCVLKHLCVKGTVNTSGIDVINIRSSQHICSEEQVCCSLPVLKPKKETCTENGKTCVPKHLCVNGTANTSGIGVISLRATEKNICSEDQVCCSLPVRKPKKETCTDNGKTCVLKHLCVNGTININGIGVISVRTPEQNICSEDQVCCAFPAQSNPSPVAHPAQECGEGNPEGLDTTSENAVAGQAKLGEFPWMVQIFEKIVSEDSFEVDILCVGSLITANKVVTAAHCIVNLTEAELYVRAGEWNPKALTEPYPHTDRRVEKRMIIHEEFDYWHPHSDIAILTLEANFLLNKHINTICLPQPDTKFDNSRCIVAGWGKRSKSDPEMWNTLKKLEVPVVNSVTCQRQLQVPFSRHFKLHSNFICAGGESQSTCDGDGGAPLMCPIAGSNRYELAGVLSYGFECNVKDVPDLYVNVPAKQSWILQHMND